MICDLIKNSMNNISGGHGVCECIHTYGIGRIKHAVLNIETCYNICCRQTGQFIIENEMYFCTPNSRDALRAKNNLLARKATKEAFKEKINKIYNNLSNLFK